MKKLCAWHPKRPFIIKVIPPYDNDGETHGICKECFLKMTARDEIGNLVYRYNPDTKEFERVENT
jgi:hypothetical protein